MKYKENELKQGIKIHTINTNKFKTNLLAVFLTTELNRKTVTKNALISMLLRRGSKNMPTQEEISKQMEEMYGAKTAVSVNPLSGVKSSWAFPPNL